MRAIRATRGFDGERILNDGMIVLIDDRQIVGVDDTSAALPEGWPVLDFVDATVLPGLIDMHVHTRVRAFALPGSAAVASGSVATSTARCWQPS